jgi:crotonobetainyl-CoA:carnitine CoA-transferase CaiB-like acyl-CoA transferase
MGDGKLRKTALSGVTVLEAAGGVAGAYCGKLFADMGAAVTRLEPESGDPLRTVRLDPDEPSTEGLYFEYLNAGKLAGASPKSCDILIVGEDRNLADDLPAPKIATLDISWFGADGDYADWAGSDLVVQALSGLVHPVGPTEGPPLFMGEHQSTLVGGLAAYCAGVAALIGGVPAKTAHYEVSILESIIIMAELQMCHSDVRGEAVPRLGVNRYLPTCPLSIHRCKEGWIGITPITPAQWRAFCLMLDLPDFADDPELQAPRGRYPHAARMEVAFDTKFPNRTAAEWAALGRRHKVPMVIVPDAMGILEHPIFNARGSLASFAVGNEVYKVPLTPLRLEGTPPLANHDAVGDSATARPLDGVESGASPLAGLRVADFSMGWAGPLATRMLADFGAEVIKIEAGRYPDWWRSVEWTPEALRRKQYEESKHFSALNRGKKSISLDLTQPDGISLAKALVAACDVVVENQAAGVMVRLGLGFEDLSRQREDLIMLSMSAFGDGNAWSDTRAYGSVLEQGSGLPSFAGKEGWPPTMAHIAYGDPIGGIYGAASLLTALYHQRQTGKGQWINNTQIESMLPFTTPALLIRQAIGREPTRRGNRHPVMAPHGCFRCAGNDDWIAIAVADDTAWVGLVQAMGRDDWAADPSFATGAGRRHREDEIEVEITAWTRAKTAGTLAASLQKFGVAAAPVHATDHVATDPHLQSRNFFYDIERPCVGRQWQAGLPFRYNGGRYPMRGLAPFLGGDSEAVLKALPGVDDDRYARLLADEIVSLVPTKLRQSTS